MAAAKEAAAVAAAKGAAEMEERWSDEEVSSWFSDEYRMDDHGGSRWSPGIYEVTFTRIYAKMVDQGSERSLVNVVWKFSGG